LKALLIFHFDSTGGIVSRFVRDDSAYAFTFAASSWVRIPFFKSKSSNGSELSPETPLNTALIRKTNTTAENQC